MIIIVIHYVYVYVYVYDNMHTYVCIYICAITWHVCVSSNYTITARRTNIQLQYMQR